MSCLIDEDLDRCLVMKRKVQKLTDSNIEKRMIRSRKLLSKWTQKTLQSAFFSEGKIFKVKQLYNSYNDVVYIPRKMRRVEVPEERSFCVSWSITQADNCFCGDIESW